MSIRLSEPATDWTRQSFEERLLLAAQTLYVHDFLQPAEFARAESQIRETADLQRQEDASRR